MIEPTATVSVARWRDADGVYACYLNVGGRCVLIADEPRRLVDEHFQSIVPADSNPALARMTHAQLLPDGGAAMAYARAEPGEKNVLVLDCSGAFQTSFAAGDGINQFLLDGQGRFWAGYFDEGVFSGDPIPSNGLARFSQDGRLEFGLAEHLGSAGPDVDDCYALTLDRQDRAWICAYSNFFLGYVDGQSFHQVMVKAPVQGARGLLVGERHVALIGGYKQTGLATVIELAGLTHRHIQLVTETGASLEVRRVSCWADMAVCWSAQGVYRFGLNDLVQIG
ncbi:hypothetical protein [Bradyrhizobium prioriisuperbiae]|uniref:hypothetical protein n=1 Tax=Bradyrhizobium prioriisuperbiae TaxID=2854389 RepID=UPI0028E25C38|nr:hypothetical protein [Bradyrhizobium prioritasuperba]